MKLKILSAFLTVIFYSTAFTQITTSLSQPGDSTSLYQQDLDHFLQSLDKAQIPTEFSKEYGAQFANLKTFNGILTDSNYVNAMTWHFIYASVYSAKIYGANTLPTPDNNYTVFNSEVVLNMGANPVKVFALNYVKQDAVPNNLLALFEKPKIDAKTNRIDISHCIRNTIFTTTTLPPE